MRSYKLLVDIQKTGIAMLYGRSITSFIDRSKSNCRSMFSSRSRYRSRFTNYILSRYRYSGVLDSGCSGERAFSTDGDGGGHPTDNDDLIECRDSRLPRRVVKRLKKQGISEETFMAKLEAMEERYRSAQERSKMSQEFDINNSFQTQKWTKSEEELQNLLRDMKTGQRHVSETELFPSDIENFYQNIKKPNTSESGVEIKLKKDPNSTSILLFPGQGSQFVGMGKKLIHFPGVKDLYEEASSVLQYDLLSLCLNGPKSELDKTVYCQTAVMITSIAALEKLREEHPKAIENCVATAGFSVGEYAALVFSGVLSFPDAIEVVKVRAEGMQRASERVSSGMLSVFVSHESNLKSAMQMAKEYCHERHGISDPVCQVANYLFPECKVLAGHSQALEFISANAKEFRLLRTKKLPVSGAFHTRLMQPAVKPLETVFQKIKLGVPKIPVFSNLTGKAYHQQTHFAHRLCQHLVKPVKWEQTMQTIYQRPQDVDFPKTFELGPSKQMGTLLKQINLQAYKSYTCIEV